MEVGRGKEPTGRGPLAPIRRVMFIDNTGGGELARRLQEAEADLGNDTGYRVRMVESAGSPLGMLLPSTNPLGPPVIGWTVYHVAREMTLDWTAGREICCNVKCVTLQRRRKRVDNS